MQTNNLTQICMYFCIALMVFTMAVNFMIGLHIFGPVTPTVGHETGNNTTDALKSFTKSPDYPAGLSTTALWGLVLGAVAIGLAIAILTQDATFVGIYIFSAVFWSSFINAWAILGSTGFLPVAFLGLFTLPIIFIFIGAVIGMLSGV